MPTNHPYVSSGTLRKAIDQFRSAFPSTVTSSTLKQLGIAPNNESYVINVFRFLDLITEDGSRATKAHEIFSKHEDEEFQKAFASIVKSAYSNLFELHGENAWTLDKDKLIAYFRNTDLTSDIVGKRQAQTFQTLSNTAGYGEEQASPKASNPKRSAKSSAQSRPTRKPNVDPTPAVNTNTSDKIHIKDQQVGLTVRIEVNLPSDCDQQTYDHIFRSIRENLLEG